MIAGWTGAPSLTNEGGSIGATDLLLASQGEVITASLAMPIQELSQKVRPFSFAALDSDPHPSCQFHTFCQARGIGPAFPCPGSPETINFFPDKSPKGPTDVALPVAPDETCIMRSV